MTKTATMFHVVEAWKLSGMGQQQYAGRIRFFGVRLDRVSGKERAYLMAMAHLGNGPYESSEVAATLGQSGQDLATTRARLIEKGMIYSPTFGLVDLTVPFFGEFLVRRQV